MPTITLYLDTRRIKQNGCAPLKFIIRNRGTSAYMSAGMDIPPQCWKDGKVILSKVKELDQLLPYPPRFLNINLNSKLVEVQETMDDLCGYKTNMTAQCIKEQIETVISGDVIKSGRPDKGLKIKDVFEEYILELTVFKTKQLYVALLQYLSKNIRHFSILTFTEVDEEWVESFVKLMRKGSAQQRALASNTVANYYTMFKSVWHYAQRKKYIGKDHEPFIGIKVTRAATRSRALCIEDMRKVWNYDVFAENVHHNAVRNLIVGRDMFILSFCLCGINMADLYELTESDIRGGRLETDRKKTGVHINVRIEPEAQEIINRYKMDGYLIGKIRKSTLGLTSQSVTAGLHRILPGLTLYWARHTWASLAVELDIPDRTVFMGLAHRQGRAADETYITMRNRKLDKANRKVIDYVLGKIEAPD